jgi:hypothetical protein
MAKIISNIPTGKGTFYVEGDTVDTKEQAHALWDTLGKDIIYYLDNWSLLVNDFGESVAADDFIEGGNLPYTFKSFRKENIPLTEAHCYVYSKNNTPKNADDIFDCYRNLSHLQDQLNRLRLLIIQNLKQDKDQAKYIEILDTVFIHSDKIRIGVCSIINILDCWDALSSWVEVFKTARSKKRGLE